MDDTVALKDLARTARGRWWIPMLLLIAGGVAGVLATSTVDRVHHAEGSLLVGSLEDSVTRSTTLRASESQAAFYADLARRQVVLSAVAKRLEPRVPWQELRTQVSATVPEKNPRVVTIRVADASAGRAEAITRHVVRELIALHPPRTAPSDQAFVAQQVASLRKAIEGMEASLESLQAAATTQKDPAQRAALEEQLTERERTLDATRQTYVDLVSLDTTGDAGAVRMLDEVVLTSAYDRAGLAKQGAAGAGIGACAGLLILLRISSRRGQRRDEPEDPSPESPVTVPQMVSAGSNGYYPEFELPVVRAPGRGA